MQYLLIEQKLHDFTLYMYQALTHFPRHEKHVLGQEIRQCIATCQRHIISAYKKHHKKTTITSLDIELALLQRHLRLATSLQYLSKRKYEIASKMLSEIGAMTGGWLRSLK